MRPANLIDYIIDQKIQAGILGPRVNLLIIFGHCIIY